MRNLLNVMSGQVGIQNDSLINEKIMKLFEDVLDEELFDELNVVIENPIRSIKEAVTRYRKSDESKIAQLTISRSVREFYLDKIKECDSNDIGKIVAISIDEVPDFVSRKTVLQIRSAYFEKLNLILINVLKNADKQTLMNLCKKYQVSILWFRDTQDLAETKASIFFLQDIGAASSKSQIKDVYEEIMSCDFIKINRFIESILLKKMRDLDYNPANEGRCLRKVFVEYKFLMSHGFVNLANNLKRLLNSEKLFNDEFELANVEELEEAMLFYDYKKIQIKIIRKMMQDIDYLKLKNVFVHLYDKVDIEISNEIIERWIELCEQNIKGKTLNEVNDFLDTIEGMFVFLGYESPVVKLIAAIYDNFLDDFIDMINQSISIDEINRFNDQYKLEVIEKVAFKRKFELAETAHEATKVYYEKPNYDFDEFTEYHFEVIINQKCVKEIRELTTVKQIKLLCETVGSVMKIDTKKYAIERAYEILAN